MGHLHDRICSFGEFGRLWAVLVLAGGSPVLALNPQTALAQYTETIWTQGQGLPQDTVRAITQTQDGHPRGSLACWKLRPTPVAERQAAETIWHACWSSHDVGASRS